MLRPLEGFEIFSSEGLYAFDPAALVTQEQLGFSDFQRLTKALSKTFPVVARDGENLIVDLLSYLVCDNRDAVDVRKVVVDSKPPQCVTLLFAG